MSTGTVARSFALIVIGLALGFALAIVRRDPNAGEGKPSAKSEPVIAAAAAEPVVRGEQVRAAYLDALAHAALTPPPAAEHAPSDDPQVNEPTPDDYVRRARSEAIDATWAPEQTAKLEAELSLASAHLDFRYSNLVCRTKQCTVDVEWRTLNAARTAFKAGFANELQQTKCLQRLLLPESARDDEPARGTLILACARPDAAPVAAQ